EELLRLGLELVVADEVAAHARRGELMPHPLGQQRVAVLRDDLGDTVRSAHVLLTRYPAPGTPARPSESSPFRPHIPALAGLSTSKRSPSDRQWGDEPGPVTSGLARSKEVLEKS